MALKMSQEFSTAAVGYYLAFQTPNTPKLEILPFYENSQTVKASRAPERKRRQKKLEKRAVGCRK